LREGAGETVRSTYNEAMEAAEVPESITKLIIGHKRPSLTYGHYSKGERVREHINKLHYSRDVMRLIRGAGRRVTHKSASAVEGRRIWQGQHAREPAITTEAETHNRRNTKRVR